MLHFQAAFDITRMLVVATEHWTWSIRPQQFTIGTSVIALRRWCPSFGQLTREEGADLAAVVFELEARMQATFRPDRMNYLMLMMRDNHVHFHVVPRYAEQRRFADRDWIDVGWPNAPRLDGEHPGDDVLLSIRDEFCAV